LPSVPGAVLLQLHAGTDHPTEIAGQPADIETYTATLHSFKEFLDGKDVQFDRVDTDLAEAYENHLKNKGICPNTISFYMRILRAVYNRAVDKGITRQNYPFRNVYTGCGEDPKESHIPKSHQENQGTGPVNAAGAVSGT
jgi:site-specific recombinase XerD